MAIFWLGLEALPREIRATQRRSRGKAPSDVGLLSRTWITRRYQRAESQTPSLNFRDFLSFWDFLQKLLDLPKITKKSQNGNFNTQIRGAAIHLIRTIQIKETTRAIPSTIKIIGQVFCKSATVVRKKSSASEEIIPPKPLLICSKVTSSKSEGSLGSVGTWILFSVRFPLASASLFEREGRQRFNVGTLFD